VRWMEVIKVRTLERTEIVQEHLARVRRTFTGMQGLANVDIYTGLTNTMDIAIHLLWENDRKPPRGSEVALRLAEELRKLGLVDYSIWIQR
jgi:hypothetical protein